MLNLKPAVTTVVAVLINVAVFVAPAHAHFTFNLSQVNNPIVVTGAGTINTSALVLNNPGRSGSASINPAFGALGAGPVSPTPQEGFTGLSGPYGFGTSNSPLSDNATFDFETFTSLGLIPGTYIYTWGSDPTADSLTLNIGTVPEPASLAMLGVLAAIALLRRRRVGWPSRSQSGKLVTIRFPSLNRSIVLAITLCINGCKSGQRGIPPDSAKQISMSASPSEYLTAIRNMEAEIGLDPDDVKARKWLISAYYDNFDDDVYTSARCRHVLWFVLHSPENEILSKPSGSKLGTLTPGETASIRIAWMEAVNDHRANISVLHNALLCDVFEDVECRGDRDWIKHLTEVAEREGRN